MKIIKKIHALRRELNKVRAQGGTVGFVPTMGALHDGHLSLIRRARRENASVVVSIFVNPAQFGRAEDLKKYPRSLARDTALCRKEGIDFLFCPSAKEIYPAGSRTYVAVEGLSEVLCGSSRPGHFRGVATVVVKLFNIVQPDKAYFGQKDFQQAIIIRRLARDLNLPIKIALMPTVRESGGLAMSSRNAYLSKQERQDALVLFRALQLAQLLVRHGQRDAGRVIRRMKELIGKKKSAKIDYVTVVDADTLAPLKKVYGKCLIALAVRVGKTRLIDNIIVTSNTSCHEKCEK